MAKTIRKAAGAATKKTSKTTRKKDGARKTARRSVRSSEAAADPEGSVVESEDDRDEATGGAAGNPGIEEAEETVGEVIRPLALGRIPGCPAGAIVVRPIDSIRPCANNPREHSEEQVEAIKASMLRWGWTVPLLVDEAGVLIAGHGRLLAAIALGATEAPTMTAAGWSKDEKRAYVIADNQLALSSTWNAALLAVELTALDDAEFDLDLLGFEDADLKSFARGPKTAAEIEQDEIPTVEEVAVSRRGDLWLLGEHRILCGDATVGDDVIEAVGGLSVDLFLTDPPYNVGYLRDVSVDEIRRRKLRTDGKVVTGDVVSDDDFRAFLGAALGNAFAEMRPGAAFYLWHADFCGYLARGAILDCDQLVRQCVIWNKGVLVLGRQDYQWKHEPCLYGWKAGAAHSWYSDRKQTTVLEFDRPFRSADHPTMKPVDLIAYQIENSSAPGETVLDPFLGSGTTLIAADQLGRRCFGLEIEPVYLDVVVRRWEALVGRSATLAENGRTFTEIAAERLPQEET